MLDLSNQTLLVIAPHPDDEIFGCGGLMHRVKKAGGSVYVLFLTVGTTADFSKSGQSTLDERMIEIENVAKLMEFDGHRMAFPGNEYHLQLDALPQKRLLQEIERGESVSLQETNPTMVAVPFPADYNQDHRAACTAILTACRPAAPEYKNFQRCILHYELPPSQWTQTTGVDAMNFFVELSEKDLAMKNKAIECYSSQLKNPDSPLSTHGITTLAQMRGLQSGSRYAEAYYCKRLVL